MARSDPRYLRFARALALVSGLVPSCALSHERPDGTDGGRRDAGTDVLVRADVAPADVPVCTTCECDDSWSEPAPGTCQALMHWECCGVVGPLAPPDLPA